jgi:Kdo2-lipid IVA lauroyltransferase/acyltransferase
MAVNRTPLNRYIAPKYWPAWIGLGLLRMVCRLPHSVALAAGRAVGRIAHLFATQRRAIVRRNLELCFPELTTAARHALAKAHFEALGISLIEMGLARWASDEHLAALMDAEGVDNVLDAVNAGKGVILLSAHFTTLEVCGRIMKLQLPPFDVVYRRSRDPFVTEFLRSGRERSAASTIEKRDIKSMVRSLRQGRPVWYAPDQSYNRKGAEVVPFFGVPCMHTTATTTLARLGNAVTIPFYTQRLPDGRYVVRYEKPLQDFPGDDAVADTRRYVATLENQIRKCPEQYFWLHRKFKNLPEPFPDYYADLDATK